MHCVLASCTLVTRHTKITYSAYVLFVPTRQALLDEKPSCFSVNSLKRVPRCDGKGRRPDRLRRKLQSCSPSMMLDLARHPPATQQTEASWMMTAINKNSSMASSTCKLCAARRVATSTSQQSGVRGILYNIDASWPDR